MSVENADNSEGKIDRIDQIIARSPIATTYFDRNLLTRNSKKYGEALTATTDAFKRELSNKPDINWIKGTLTPLYKRFGDIFNVALLHNNIEEIITMFLGIGYQVANQKDVDAITRKVAVASLDRRIYSQELMGKIFEIPAYESEIIPFIQATLKAGVELRKRKVNLDDLGEFPSAFVKFVTEDLNMAGFDGNGTDTLRSDDVL